MRRPPLEDLFAGGGDVGELMRAFDWAANPLGPVHSWPANLKTCVRIILTSRQPMFVWWGPRLINLYNDAYRSIVGGKHPVALGQPAETVWREIWDQVGPRAEATMRGQVGTYDEALLLIMERNGYPEETYYTFSYSPVPDDLGGPGGILCANTDDTQRIVGSRRMALLREVAARTTGARTRREVCEMGSAALATEGRDIPFALLYLPEPGGEALILEGSPGMEPGHPAAPARLTPSAAGSVPYAGKDAPGSGERIVAAAELPGPLPAGAWERPPAQVALVPVPSARPGERTGVLVVGLNPFRPWDEDYRSFLSLAAGQIGSSLATVQAYEDERRRAEALAELDRAKSAFFSNVSHEFRTPLTLMLGPLEDCLEEGPVGLAAAHRERLEIVYRNGRRLQKLVNNLLDFSRLEAGRVQAKLAPTDLSALTTDLASMFRSAVERAGLAFEVDCPPLPEPVLVDREMWEKIVLNLLSNALKFTFSGSIGVSLRQGPGGLQLRVSDTGVGIPASELPRVFTRFHRVEGSQSRNHEGSGIGLALVQELAKLHGGTVGVESEPGRGTSFTVIVPLAKASVEPGVAEGGGASQVAAPQSRDYLDEASRWLPDEGATARIGADRLPFSQGSGAIRPDPDGARSRILLVDDNRDMRDYVARILATTWDVETAADGAAALERARKHPPDLVLSDVMMPGMDGFQLLRALRADAGTAAIPVILLSARAGEEATVEGLEAGADDYLVKPFSSRELLARVAGRLEIDRLRRRQESLEREHARRLSVSEALSRSIIAQSPDCIKILDAESRLLSMNESGLVIMGIRDFAEIQGKDYVSLWQGAAREAARAAVDSALAGKTGRFQGEFPVEQTGEMKCWDVIITPLEDRDGRVDRLLAVSRDVTSMREAERELHKFRSLVEESSDFIGIGDMAGGPLYINAAGLRMVGLDDGRDYRSLKSLEFYFPEDMEALERAGEALAQTGQWQGELRLRHFRTGKAIPVGMNVFYLRDWQTHQPFAVATVTRDLTRLKDAEAHLLQAQKMEAIGKLAGGIAHDFNNLLTAINGFAGLALPYAQGIPELGEFLSEILKSGERAAQLTGQLLAYSRKQVLAPKALNLNDVVSDMETMLRRLIGEDVELVTRLDSDLGWIQADPGQIQQVILNLALNARDAMPDGGRLVIETANEIPDESFVTRHELRPGPHAVLSVADSGVGMPPEVRERIFEPFFTTKPIGKGTGMGLPSVFGIVKQSGGAISVASEPGRGATFLIYLPLSGGPEEKLPEEEAEPLPKGRETLLLVEDEETVRRFIEFSLARAGYHVLPARDGEEALRVSRGHEGDIHALVTDVVMPRMGGHRLAEKIRAERPSTRILFMSGYTDADIVRNGLLEPGTDYLQKPFRPEALLKKIQSILKGQDAT